ncbi:MAG: esterase-like activity of phytase family protein [Pseudomonadota bacterium]
MRALICLFTFLLVAGALEARAEPPALTFVGEFRLPTGLKVDGVEIGGLSAVDYDPASGEYFALSDDRIEFGPARFYRLAIDLSAEGIRSVDIRERIEILNPDGESYGQRGADPEGMRLADGVLVWAHERDENGRPYAGIMRLDGRQVRAFDLPDSYYPTADGGIRTNLGFESLTLSADRQSVILANENALRQDGPKASVDEPSPARMIVFDLQSGDQTGEHVYMTETVADAPERADQLQTNGLVELLALEDGTLLAMERSFSAGRGNVIRLFHVDMAGATDVSGLESLRDQPVTPVSKTPILTLRAGDPTDRIDNVEAMTFGPVVDGKRTLLLLSDNNFNRRGQFTQFLLYTID